MTVSMWEVYLLLKLDAFQEALVAFGIIGGCISIILLCCGCNRSDNFSGFTKVLFCMSPIVPATALLLGIIMPSTKQAAVIYAAPRILNSEFIQKDVPAEAKEIYGLAKQWLEEQAGGKKTKREGEN